MNTLDVALEMFYSLNCTIQRDKNPLNTSDNTVVHTACRDEYNALFLTAGRSKKKKKFQKTFQKSCISNYTTAPNGLVAMAISYLITSNAIKKKNRNKKKLIEG